MLAANVLSLFVTYFPMITVIFYQLQFVVVYDTCQFFRRILGWSFSGSN